MRFFLPVFFLFFYLQSCESNRPRHKHTQIKKLEWLLGSWQDTSGATNFTENWQKENDSTFSGSGYGVERGDTIFTEKLQLAERNGKVYYVATVNEHLAGKPITFALADHTDSSWVFENPHHDFPRRITYIKRTGNALYAKVEGEVNGKLLGEEFMMHRFD